MKGWIFSNKKLPKVENTLREHVRTGRHRYTRGIPRRPDEVSFNEPVKVSDEVPKDKEIKELKRLLVQKDKEIEELKKVSDEKTEEIPIDDTVKIPEKFEYVTFLMKFFVPFLMTFFVFLVT